MFNLECMSSRMSCVILVSYTHDNTVQALRFFRFLRAGKKILVLNEPGLKDSPSVGRLSSGWHVVDGTNSAGEFSGWQEGINCLSDKQFYGLYILANDTVCAHRRFTPLRLFLFAMAAAIKPDKVIGFIDSFSMEYELNNVRSSSWVSTYLFGVPKAALERLSWTVDYSLILSRYTVDCLEESRFFSEDLDPRLRKHLSAWLFSGGWYKSAQLSEGNRTMFLRKAQRILNEKYLSALFVSKGFSLHDVFGGNSFLFKLDRVMAFFGIYFV